MRLGWWLVKAGISLGLLGFLVWRANVVQLWQAISGAQPWLVLSALGMALGAWLVNTYKWQRLLEALGAQVGFWRLFVLNFVGLFYSLFLPGQVGGEVVKGMKLARDSGRAADVAVSIVMDRLTGLAALAFIVLVGVMVSPQVPGGAFLLVLAACLLALCMAPLLLLVVSPQVPLPFWLRRLFGRLGPLGEGAVSLWGSFAVYRHTPRVLGLAALYALGFQLLVAASNYLVSLGVGVEVPFLTLMWIVAVVSVLHLVPVSFSGLGIREGAYVLLLSQQGVPIADGLALALIVFGIILAQGLLGGVLETVFSGREALSPS